MKLYKFRPLANCQDLTRAQEILETGMFWCSHFWELNDPMEGVYLFNTGTLGANFIEKLYDKKSKLTICSFSGDKAFKKPIMWGYYANGFKGIAVEIEANVEDHDIHPVNYKNDITSISNDKDEDDAASRILTTKHRCWSREDEYRYLDTKHGSNKIGTITSVCIGDPYSKIVNAHNLQNHTLIREYRCRVEALERTAIEMGIACHRVEVDCGCVKIVSEDEGARRKS